MKTTFPYFLYTRLPPKLRFMLKQALGASGHAQSASDRLKAAKDAIGKRRLDQSVSRFLAILEKCAMRDFSGRVCLDFGAGYVLTDSLAMYLLGAKKVLALDYFPIADWEATRRAVIASSEEDLLRLVPAALSGTVRRRYREICLAVKAGREGTSSLGVEYIAPIDMSIQRIDETVDFIYSISTLEHLKSELVEKILENLYHKCASDIVTFHEIHLEDHQDFVNAPFAFLLNNGKYNPDRDFDSRGNRLRPSDWRRYFSAIRIGEFTFESSTNGLGYSNQGIRRVLLPRGAEVLAEFKEYPPDDLFTSYLHVYTTVKREG